MSATAFTIMETAAGLGITVTTIASFIWFVFFKAERLQKTFCCLVTLCTDKGTSVAVMVALEKISLSSVAAESVPLVMVTKIVESQLVMEDKDLLK